MPSIPSTPPTNSVRTNAADAGSLLAGAAAGISADGRVVQVAPPDEPRAEGVHQKAQPTRAGGLNHQPSDMTEQVTSFLSRDEVARLDATSHRLQSAIRESEPARQMLQARVAYLSSVGRDAVQEKAQHGPQRAEDLLKADLQRLGISSTHNEEIGNFNRRLTNDISEVLFSLLGNLNDASHRLDRIEGFARDEAANHRPFSLQLLLAEMHPDNPGPERTLQRIDELYSQLASSKPGSMVRQFFDRHASRVGEVRRWCVREIAAKNLPTRHEMYTESIGELFDAMAREPQRVRRLLNHHIQQYLGHENLEQDLVDAVKRFIEAGGPQAVAAGSNLLDRAEAILSIQRSDVFAPIPERYTPVTTPIQQALQELRGDVEGSTGTVMDTPD